MVDIPLVMTAAGPVPTPPATLRADLVEGVAATNPGYTADLPASLIEDIASTDVGALAVCDAARVEAVNSLTPRTANPFLLAQLGQIYGVEPGAASNTSVFVVFTGSPGFVIAKGFVVSDGTYQYVVQDGGVIATDTNSDPLFAVATVGGSWSVSTNSVSQLVTSVPDNVTLAVTNPQPGTPAGEPESEASYRAAVLRAGLAASQGMASYLKTLLRNVAGVQPRLIGIKQVANNGGWEIIVGGGDPYQVAYAIYDALFDINTLVGSQLAITNITQANPAVVTTNLNHNFASGQTIEQIDVLGMVELNGEFVVTVLSPTTYSVPVNSTGFPAYISGGVFVPNPRDIVVTLSDFPDVYQITFVNPPQQTVEITATWNTTAVNFTSTAAVAQLATPALVDYVNNVFAGQPMNQFVLDTVFQEAIVSVLPAYLLTRLIFSVSINGIAVVPQTGTGIIAGDPESYFLTDATKITILQG